MILIFIVACKKIVNPLDGCKVLIVTTKYSPYFKETKQSQW
jgi:hypothetical protein